MTYVDNPVGSYMVPGGIQIEPKLMAVGTNSICKSAHLLDDLYSLPEAAAHELAIVAFIHDLNILLLFFNCSTQLGLLICQPEHAQLQKQLAFSHFAVDLPVNMV